MSKSVVPLAIFRGNIGMKTLQWTVAMIVDVLMLNKAHPNELVKNPHLFLSKKWLVRHFVRQDIWDSLTNDTLMPF